MAAMATSLFACSEPELENGTDLDAAKSVTLSIKQALPKSSRGVSDQKGPTEYAVIGSAKIYFLDNADTDVFHRELTAAEIAIIANTSSTPSSNNTINIAGVPTSAETLYFVANVATAEGTTFPAIEGTGSAGARLRIDKLQADDKHVPMAGRSNVFVAGANNTFTASVALTPLVARVEVGKVSYENQNGATAAPVSSDITGYKLMGVYLNNIHNAVLLAGTPYANSLVDIRTQGAWMDPAGWPAFFTSSNTNFPYFVGGTPAAPADWVANSMVTYCSPASSGLEFFPSDADGSTITDPALNQVWGYQVSPSSVPTVGAAVDIPHIVLKLTDVVYENDIFGKSTQYVTVEKYKDQAGDPILEFKRGNIYRITDLKFTHINASDKPYEQNMLVTVTVTVEPWIINNITPDWGV